MQYLDFIIYKYLLICCIGKVVSELITYTFGRNKFYQLEFSICILFFLSLALQYPVKIYIFLSYWVHSFLSHSLLVLISFICNTIRFTATICVLFWFPQYPGLFLKFFQTLKFPLWGFPGDAVAENLPANAGDTGSSPGLGRSYMPRSSWAREPQLLSLRVWSLCPATGGAAIVKGPRTAMKSSPRTAMKSGPHLPQLEKALTRKLRDPTQS